MMEIFGGLEAVNRPITFSPALVFIEHYCAAYLCPPLLSKEINTYLSALVNDLVIKLIQRDLGDLPQYGSDYPMFRYHVGWLI